MRISTVEGIAGGEMVTQRIVNISRKNRELQAELSTEKNRVRQLQSRLKETREAHKLEVILTT